MQDTLANCLRLNANDNMTTTTTTTRKKRTRLRFTTTTRRKKLIQVNINQQQDDDQHEENVVFVAPKMTTNTNCSINTFHLLVFITIALIFQSSLLLTSITSTVEALQLSPQQQRNSQQQQQQQKSDIIKLPFQFGVNKPNERRNNYNISELTGKSSWCGDTQQ